MYTDNIRPSNATNIPNAFQKENKDMSSPENRVNSIIISRKDQLANNLLALTGGMPYIRARLSRFPSETNIDFLGDGSRGVEGRLNRAYLFNYGKRIIQKISQYVFQQLPNRINVPEEFLLNATKNDMSYNDFILKAFEYYEACGWCWIKANAPSLEQAAEGEVLTLADAENIYPYLSLYSALEVVDWYFENGKLQWCITETLEQDNSDPTKPAEFYKERKLYTPNTIIEYYINPITGQTEKTEANVNPFGFVPFIVFGEPTNTPWYFDDVERVNKSILDLESSFDHSLFRTIYPQLVIPADLVRSITEQRPNTSFDEAVSLVLGLNYPVMETNESKSITRYIEPPTADLEALRRDINERRKALYELMGIVLHLSDTKMVESAAAKQFEYLDLIMVLREKANKLERMEKKIFQMLSFIDERFTDVTIEYNRKFDVTDAATQFEALIKARELVGDSVTITDKASKILDLI